MQLYIDMNREKESGIWNLKTDPTINKNDTN